MKVTTTYTNRIVRWTTILRLFYVSFIYMLVYISCAVLLLLGSPRGLWAGQLERTDLPGCISATCTCSCCQMGNCLMSYRAEIGLFYNRCQKIGRICKVSMSFYFSLSILIRVIKQLCRLTDRNLWRFAMPMFIIIVLAYALFSMLLLMSGDIESNPGPSWALPYL